MTGWEPRELRRIVTETDERGRSTCTAGVAPTILEPPDGQGTWIADEWVTDATPTDLEGADLAGREWQLEPPPGGSAFRLFQLPPRGVDGHASALHRTATVDYVVVVSGTMWLVVDTGEVELGPGDCVIQRGTSHAWENRSSEPCVAAAVLISARPGERR